MSTQRSRHDTRTAFEGSVERHTALLVLKILGSRPKIFSSEIQQLCFCGDLYAAGTYDRRLSKVTYEANMYGPFSEEIDSVLDTLKEQNVVQTDPALRGRRRSETYSVAHGAESVLDTEDDISETSKRLVRYVCNEAAPPDSDRLESLVTDSPPYKSAGGGAEIEFHSNEEALSEFVTEQLSGSAAPDVDEGQLLNLN